MHFMQAMLAAHAQLHNAHAPRRDEINPVAVTHVESALNDGGTLLEKFWRISLYVTYDAIAKLYCDVYFSQIVGNDGKISSHTAKQLRHQLDFPTVYLSVASGCHVSKALNSSLTWRNTS